MGKLTKYILEPIDEVADRTIIVLGVAGAAQLPAFMDQYLQNLSGKKEQAKKTVEDFKEQANTSVRQAPTGSIDKTCLQEHPVDCLDTAIGYHLGSSDVVFRGSGRAMQNAKDDYTELSASYKDLSTAKPIERVVPFARHFNKNIASDTAKNFTPAVPLSTEGGVCALTGALVLWCVYKGTIGLVKRMFRKKPTANDGQ